MKLLEIHFKSHQIKSNHTSFKSYIYPGAGVNVVVDPTETCRLAACFCFHSTQTFSQQAEAVVHFLRPFGEFAFAFASDSSCSHSPLPMSSAAPAPRRRPPPPRRPRHLHRHPRATEPPRHRSGRRSTAAVGAGAPEEAPGLADPAQGHHPFPSSSPTRPRRGRGPSPHTTAPGGPSRVPSVSGPKTLAVATRGKTLFASAAASASGKNLFTAAASSSSTSGKTLLAAATATSIRGKTLVASATASTRGKTLFAAATFGSGTPLLAAAASSSSSSFRCGRETLRTASDRRSRGTGSRNKAAEDHTKGTDDQKKGPQRHDRGREGCGGGGFSCQRRGTAWEGTRAGQLLSKCCRGRRSGGEGAQGAEGAEFWGKHN